MDFEVLPGPSLPELARTAMARAVAATVRCRGVGEFIPATVPVRADQGGQPVLLPRDGSAFARQLAASPVTVTLAVPAAAPFSALRLTGDTHPAEPDTSPGGPGAYSVRLRSVEFTGGVPAIVAIKQYEAAKPDPFWREAPIVLRHLEHCHMDDLVHCVQAHGMLAAESVIPRGLDRYGLELLVLTPDGLANVRLAYPGGPVATLQEVPVSIRAVLTCRCGERSHQRG
jgi:hypothetical protein